MELELVTVGTELLLGQVTDTNAAEIGRALADAGIRVARRVTVADDPAEIRRAVAAALERAGAVLVTGGLGPTADDLTRPAVAEALGKRLVRDPAILESLQALYSRRGVPTMPDANRSQADVPAGAVVLPNPWGTAPGLWVEDERGRLTVLLPGVPREMCGLLEQEVLPRLKGRMAQGRGGAGPPLGEPKPEASRPPGVIRSRVLRTSGVAESALADQLGDPGRWLPRWVTLASLPSLDGVDLVLTAWNLPPDEADGALAKAVEALGPLLGEHCYGEDGDDLAAVVLRELERAGSRLAVAESCTGGLIGERITAVPGSSRVFVGGIVAYHDDAKLGVLGVSADAIAEHGAVSDVVVRQMAEGAARTLGADAAVAVTGIAGPSGGTVEKPVGTVWIGVLWRGAVRIFTHLLPGGREEVRRRAAQAALNYLRRVARGTL